MALGFVVDSGSCHWDDRDVCMSAPSEGGDSLDGLGCGTIIQGCLVVPVSSFSSQSARMERETYTFLYPLSLAGSGTPSERYTMIGAKPTKVAIKKRKSRHMQRLRRTFRGVIKRGSASPLYTKSGAIVEEKGFDEKRCSLSASRCELANLDSYWIRAVLMALPPTRPCRGNTRPEGHVHLQRSLTSRIPGIYGHYKHPWCA